ncbi:hypothetical protein F4806DRAFT_314993 [Annulohypoxylon nitens]|nr:hypothetical protein F4806DRAFT_314993 [Annulohypoxylon nitens]
MSHPPPPYSAEATSEPAQPARQVPDLEPWQRRWNREWFKHAFANGMRRIYAFKTLPVCDRNKRKTRKLHRAMVAAHVREAIEIGIADEEDSIPLSWWWRVTNFFFWHPKEEFNAFREWRRDRKNRERNWKVIAVMEDVGENPKWKGEMTFKISREQWSEFANEERWFDFPSPENIKWFWLVRPLPWGRDVQSLPKPSRRHWGPDTHQGHRGVFMPFRRTTKGIVRNDRSNIRDFGYWHNFREDLGRGRFVSGVIRSQP